VKLGKDTPVVKGAFVAPCATIVGKVEVASGSSIWYGVVIRGDDSNVKIGSGSSIGDRTMIHCSKYPKDLPALIGDGVLVGAGSILHGCILEDSCMVGAGAQVLDGATVGKQAIVAAGSVVGSGKLIPAGQMWAGVPAKFVRDVTPQEIDQIVAAALEDVALAGQHALETAKGWEQIEQEEYDYEQRVGRNEGYYRRLSPEGLSKKLGEIENHMVPGRILDSDVSARGYKKA